MAGPTLFRPDSIATGLQGYWKLDEASGNRADSSGNSNTLTDNATVASVAQDYWNTGENSADFERSNSEYLSITNAAQTGLDIDGVGGSVTMAFWMKMETTGAGQSMIGMSNNSTGYKLQLTTSNTMRLRINGSNNDSSSTFSSGKWYHIVGVFDEPNDLVQIYINGNLDVALSETNTITANAHDFMIASEDPGTAAYYDGLMKDAAVWNRVLTPLEIKSLAMGVDLSSAAYRPDTVGTQPDAYWKMNEVSGPLTDSAGSNDASQTGVVPRGAGYVEGAGLDMDGAVGKYFTVSNASGDFDFGTGDFSMACWIKPTTTGDSKWLDGGAGAGDLSMGIDSNTTLRVGLNGTAKDFASFFTSGANPWMHIAVVRNSGTLYAYKDGVEFGNTASSESVTLSGSLRICQNDSGAERQTGQLADLATWKGYALSTDEVLGLASAMPIQQSGIVSYWNMDGSAGAGENDQIGSNDLTHNASSGSIGSVAGQVDEARDFESTGGENQYLSIADNVPLSITRDISVMCWIKPETNVVNTGYVVKNSTSAYALFSGSSGIRFRCGGASPLDSTTPPIGTWTHYIGVGDGADTRIYTNSVEKNNTVGANLPSDTADALWVGRNSAYYDGVIDEVVIATRWFREEEVKVAYINGLNGVVVTNEPIPTGNTGGFFAIL